MTIRLLRACLLICLAGLPGRADPAKVTTIDGGSFTGRLLAIGTDQAEFATGAGVRKLPVRDLWRIRLGDHRDPMQVPGQKVLTLTGKGGGMLAARDLSVKDGKVHLRNDLLGRAAVDISSAAAMYLPPRGQTPGAYRRRLDAMRLAQDRTDYLLAKDRKGNWVPVPGVFKGIAGGKVTFEFDGEDRTIDLALVSAVLLGRVGVEGAAPAGQIVGTDGSVVPFRAISVVGDRVSITAPGLRAGPVSLSAVAEIRFGSERCVYLSDLSPAKVTQVGLFDVVFPYRRDRSAAGGPIRLAGRTYDRGLGLHSRCELVYDLPGGFATFAALAGIDEAGGSRGNATLKVLGDGRELIAPTRLAGSGKPVRLRCALAGVKRLTITVDFGDDGIDVGDHVSLAEARLIKP